MNFTTRQSFYLPAAPQSIHYIILEEKLLLTSPWLDLARFSATYTQWAAGGVRAVLLTQWRRSRTLYNLNKHRNNYTNLDSSSASPLRELLANTQVELRRLRGGA